MSIRCKLGLHTFVVVDEECWECEAKDYYQVCIRCKKERAADYSYIFRYPRTVSKEERRRLKL